MKIIVKEPGKAPAIKQTEEKYRTKACKPYIAGEDSDTIVQFLKLDEKGTLWMGCDEEGLLKDLPTNFYLHNGFFAERIVGNVVFIRTDYIAGERFFTEEIYDYETKPLTAEDISFVLSLLDERKQKELKEQNESNPVNPFGSFFG